MNWIIRCIHVSFELWGCFFCIIAAICVYERENLINTKDRKMFLMQIVGVMLLLSDSLAWIFRGGSGTAAYYIVRISNFMVFASNYIIMAIFTSYLKSSFTDKRKEEIDSFLYKIVYALSFFSIVLLIVSQFNHMYYYFDVNNFYHRQGLFWLSQATGIIGIGIDGIILITKRKLLSREVFVSLLSYMLFPLLALIIQLFVYGISLLNIAIILSILFVFTSSQIEQSRQLVEQQRKISELKVSIMLSQIQPHFLYNSLNSIYYLCDKDSEMAKSAISNFSEYLRGNLDSLKTRVLVPFDMELKHIKSYLYLEQLRFEDELHISYNIQTTAFMLPSLTVQPLVENAVKHGVGKKDGGGTVWIVVIETEESYRIMVRDNGVGYTSHSSVDDEEQHIGITNVKQRLEAMCGGTLEISGIENQGTTAVVAIPKT